MRVLIIILIVVLISIAVGGAYYYFQEEKIIIEDVVFNEDFIKKGKINIYCPVQLKEGFFSTESLSFYCDDEKLPDRGFLLSVEDVVFNEDSAYVLVKSSFEGFPERHDIVVINEKKGQFIAHNFGEEVASLGWESDFLKVHFSNEEKKYRIIRDRVEEVVDEEVLYGSAQFGFFVKIPQNWKVTKVNNSFLFYHPNSFYDYPVTLKIEEKKGEKFSFQRNEYFYNIETAENTPYKDVYEKITTSFKVNDLYVLPDYTFLEEGLDNYLKIDTEEKTLTYYGETEEVFHILNMIDRENWGGTPSGLYEVLSKEGLRFSTTSSVYMPFSVRFYGKYLVHGEPYYPSGMPYTLPVSGGCIRVKTEKMKELYELLEEETPILIIPNKNDQFFPEEKNIFPFPQISAESYLVADIESGKVFVDKNPEEARPIASITKIMTGLVIAEHFDTEHPIRVQEYMLTGYGQTAGIYTGRVLRLVDLLAPLLIESSNNAAKVLASYFGEEDTVKRMNEKAKMIGMMNTTFTESSGIDKGNISTAKDVYYLAYYLANSRPPFLNISRGVWTPNINYAVFPNLRSKNIFYSDSRFIGGKSGYIEESKYTGVYLFNLKIDETERKVVFVVLGSPTKESMEKDVRDLKRWIENSFD